MVRHVVLFWGAVLWACGAWGAAEVASVICSDGAKHTMRLTQVEPGTLDSREARSIHLGPSQSVWVELPSGATLAEHEPVPVRDIKADRVELEIKHGNGRRETVTLTARRSSAEGYRKVDLIQARVQTYSYALPANCRVMSAAERQNYALALLNNAGCLLPVSVHRALARIPGAYGRMAADCGWATDTRLALRALEKAAERGSLHAGWVLSQFYLGNVDPSFQDHGRAYLSLSHAAGVGHASADLMAGVMRWRGDGVTPDAQAAFTALLPHARAGAREAQGIIGTMYLTGEGAPVNLIHAYAWCSLASSGGALLHSDAESCKRAAEAELSYDEVLDARDLAVQIHNGDY